MNKPKTIQPEEIFAQALQQDRPQLTDKDMRLLVSGYTALQASRGKPLNDVEMMAVTAMVAYTAYKNQTCEDKVRMILNAQFSVSEIAQIPSQQYPNVIQFLVDLEIPRVLN